MIIEYQEEECELHVWTIFDPTTLQGTCTVRYVYYEVRILQVLKHWRLRRIGNKFCRGWFVALDGGNVPHSSTTLTVTLHLV